jgi:hypothetical protein
MGFSDIADTVIGACNDVFGQDVTYNHSGGASETITAVFDNAFVETLTGVTSLKPVLRIRLSDLSSAPAKGDTVTISSTTYRVLESQNDAFGGSVLYLQKV